jgi:ribosomal protein S18 acetylase RimI-like enzyme
MSEYTTRIYTPTDWQKYRYLRLRSLEDSPNAFGTTYEQAKEYPDSLWQSRLENISAANDCPVVAELKGNPVGHAWGRIEPSCTDEAQLFQMWVTPDHRGKGISRKMLDAIINWAVTRQASSVALSVTCNNLPAIGLYKSAGFEGFGQPEALRTGSNILVQPMRLIF